MKSLVFALFLSLGIASIQAQEIPKLLPFQGRLTDAQGVPVTNGVKLVQFLLYTNATGGTPVWAGEIHRTTVNGGLVNVILGTKTPLAGVDFNQQVYLEITVDANGDSQITSDDPPLLPRQIILPALFTKEAAVARNSSTLNGADWTAILATGTDPRDPASFINAGKLQPGSLTGAQFAAGSINTTNLAPNAVVDTNLAPASVGLAALKQELINQLVPPGTIIAYGGAITSFFGTYLNVPPGWLVCDGGAYDRTQYSALFQAIGTAWGSDGFSSNGFQVPDLRGQFLRGASAGTGRDPDAYARTSLYIGGNVGDNVGSYQQHQIASHTHPLNVNNGNGAVLGVFVPGSVNPGWDKPGSYWGNLQTLNIQVLPTGGAETRPINAAVVYIIKY